MCTLQQVQFACYNVHNAISIEPVYLKENFSTIDEKVAIILPDLKTAEVKSWCSSVPIVKRPTQKSSYVHISYVGASKEMKIVENYEMKLVFLTSPP